MYGGWLLLKSRMGVCKIYYPWCSVQEDRYEECKETERDTEGDTEGETEGETERQTETDRDSYALPSCFLSTVPCSSSCNQHCSALLCSVVVASCSAGR